MILTNKNGIFPIAFELFQRELPPRIDGALCFKLATDIKKTPTFFRFYIFLKVFHTLFPAILGFGLVYAQLTFFKTS